MQLIESHELAIIYRQEERGEGGGGSREVLAVAQKRFPVTHIRLCSIFMISPLPEVNWP